jgi:hypothetical protein
LKYYILIWFNWLFKRFLFLSNAFCRFCERNQRFYRNICLRFYRNILTQELISSRVYQKFTCLQCDYALPFLQIFVPRSRSLVWAKHTLNSWALIFDTFRPRLGWIIFSFQSEYVGHICWTKACYPQIITNTKVVHVECSIKCQNEINKLGWYYISCECFVWLLGKFGRRKDGNCKRQFVY